jgi:hypothetical protein
MPLTVYIHTNVFCQLYVWMLSFRILYVTSARLPCVVLTSLDNIIAGLTRMALLILSPKSTIIHAQNCLRVLISDQVGVVSLSILACVKASASVLFCTFRFVCFWRDHESINLLFGVVPTFTYSVVQRNACCSCLVQILSDFCVLIKCFFYVYCTC